MGGEVGLKSCDSLFVRWVKENIVSMTKVFIKYGCVIGNTRDTLDGLRFLDEHEYPCHHFHLKQQYSVILETV